MINQYIGWMILFGMTNNRLYWAINLLLDDTYLFSFFLLILSKRLNPLLQPHPGSPSALPPLICVAAPCPPYPIVSLAGEVAVTFKH